MNTKEKSRFVRQKSPVENRLKRYLSCFTNFKRSAKISDVFFGRGLHKVNKASDHRALPQRHLSNYLPRRHVVPELAFGLTQDLTTALHLLQNLGFVVKMTKSHLIPYHTLGIPRFPYPYKGLILILPQSKVTAI